MRYTKRSLGLRSHALFWRRKPLVVPSLDCAIILALFGANLFLIAPYLHLDLASQPWNNDYAYLSMIRMFRDHPWTWNSLQYGGAPFAYVYPPLFHVIAAALPVGSLGRAYHLTSGAGYALVPVSLYILSIQLFRSRWRVSRMRPGSRIRSDARLIRSAVAAA